MGLEGNSQIKFGIIVISKIPALYIYIDQNAIIFPSLYHTPISQQIFNSLSLEKVIQTGKSDSASGFNLQ